MPDQELLDLGEERCLVAAADGPLVQSADDARDLIGAAMSHRATAIAVPVSRLDPSFFQLRSGLAGEILQKAANYRLKFAVIGDISAQIAASDALRDFVLESNRGTSIIFAADLPAFKERLAALHHAD